MLLVINWTFFEILKKLKNEGFKDDEILRILSLKYI